MSYLYETHMHTFPASKCGRATVRESLEFYKSLGYEGVFITNHFIDGNIGCDHSLPYEEKIHFYFADYEEGLVVGKELGISVFCGVEVTCGGTDFLVYGLDKEWFLAHPEIEDMSMSAKLSLFAEAGALIIQAHPFRERGYIDHIRLFPRHIHGVEVYNASEIKTNEMARLYADFYGLIHFAGSDNHRGGAKKEGVPKRLGGMESAEPLADVQDFIARFLDGSLTPFFRQLPD